MISITEANISEYSIEDVVMPMIGHNTRLPENEELRQIILDILKADGLSMETFDKHAKLDATSASGAYRKILARPDQVWHDIIDMQDENEDLLSTNYLQTPDPTPKIDTNLPHSKALRIRFNLKTSSYATMLLREITRTSSAFSTQYKLSLN